MSYLYRLKRKLIKIRRVLLSSNLRYYHRFEDHDWGRWIVGYEDCRRLQELVRQYNITSVLELGSGIGTGTYALTEAGAKVWCVEHVPECIKIAQELIPAHLQEKVNFWLSDLKRERRTFLPNASNRSF